MSAGWFEKSWDDFKVERRRKHKVQYQKISSGVGGNATVVSAVYHVLTLTNVAGSEEHCELVVAMVSASGLWWWFGVFTRVTTQVSSLAASQMSSGLTTLELLLSRASDLFIDLQRFAAVDSWMRFVWLALCPTLFLVLLAKTAIGWRGWWRWWYGCCCVGPLRLEFTPNDGDKFLWLWLSHSFDLVDPLPKIPVVGWTFNVAEAPHDCRCLCSLSGTRLSSCVFCDVIDEVKLLRLPSNSLPLGHMVESNTSIELVMAWSHRQQSRNSSIVTTPSWLRSIFYEIPFPEEEKREQRDNK